MSWTYCWVCPDFLRPLSYYSIVCNGPFLYGLTQIGARVYAIALFWDIFLALFLIRGRSPFWKPLAWDSWSLSVPILFENTRYMSYLVTRVFPFGEDSTGRPLRTSCQYILLLSIRIYCIIAYITNVFRIVMN